MLNSIQVFVYSCGEGVSKYHFRGNSFPRRRLCPKDTMCDCAEQCTSGLGMGYIWCRASSERAGVGG